MVAALLGLVAVAVGVVLSCSLGQSSVGLGHWEEAVDKHCLALVVVLGSWVLLLQYLKVEVRY